MDGYVGFQEQATTTKTRKVAVISNHVGRQIGTIKWKSQWRRYNFFPGRDTTFDSSCLKEIAEYIDGMMSERSKS